MKCPLPPSCLFRRSLKVLVLLVACAGCQFGVGPGSNEAGQVLRVRLFEGGVPASVEFGNRWRVWQVQSQDGTNTVPPSTNPPWTNGPLPFQGTLPDPLALRSARVLSPAVEPGDCGRPQ